MFDAHANFGASTVATAPVPALTGLSLTVAGGQGALFPAAPFNCTVWPAGVAPIASNAEIVRVTLVMGDVFTIVRGQEGTAAVPIAAGYQIANTSTRLVFTTIENSIIQEIVAGGATATASQVSFADSNGVSFGIAGQTVTASVAGAAQTTQPVAASAGGQSFLFSTIAFVDSNGIGFGTVPGPGITASHNGLTTQTVQPVAAGAGGAGQSFLFSTLTFADSNGISFSTTAGNSIVAFHNGLTSQSNQAFNAPAGGLSTFQTLSFLNAGGLSWSNNAGSIQATYTVPGATSFANANNITFGLAGSTITASATVASTQASIVVAAAGSTNTVSQVTFSNGSNVFFGLNGSVITASASVASTQASIVVSAGTSSASVSQVVFSNSNGIVFGLNGSTVTAQGPWLSFLEPIAFGGGSVSSQALGSITNPVFDPFIVPQNLSMKRIKMMATWAGAWASTNAANSATCGFTRFFGIYSRSVTDSGATNFSNSTNLVLMFNTSFTNRWGWSGSGSSISVSLGWGTDATGGSSTFSSSTNSSNLILTQLNGHKYFTIGAETSLSAGEYWAGQLGTATTSGSNATVMFPGNGTLWVQPYMTNASFGPGFNVASNTTALLVRGLGAYTATSAVLPATVAMTDISLFSFQRRYFQFEC